MKRFAFAFLAILFLILSVSVSAHPGRTDEDGGHYDRSTGEYHWHHGYEAHQHYDINGDGVLDCPYDFNEFYNKELFLNALLFPTAGLTIAILIFMILLCVKKDKKELSFEFLERKFPVISWVLVPLLVMGLMVFVDIMGVSFCDQNEYWSMIPFIEPLFSGWVGAFVMIYTAACPFALLILLYEHEVVWLSLLLHISWVVYSFMCTALCGVVFLIDAYGAGEIIMCCIFTIIYSTYIIVYTNDISAIIANKINRRKANSCG